MLLDIGSECSAERTAPGGNEGPPAKMFQQKAQSKDTKQKETQGSGPRALNQGQWDAHLLLPGYTSKHTADVAEWLDRRLK